MKQLNDNGMLFILIILCVICVCGFAVYSLITGKPLTNIQGLITFLTTMATTMYNFKWGSSAGSKSKDAAIANSTPIIPNVPASTPGQQ